MFTRSSVWIALLSISATLLMCGCTTLSGSRRDARVSRQPLPTQVVVKRLENRSGGGHAALDHDVTALLIASLVNQPTLEVAAPAQDRDMLDRLRRTRNSFWPPLKALKTLSSEAAKDAFIVSGSITEYTPDAKRGEARVTLRVQLQDPATGHTLAVISASGEARSRRNRDANTSPFGSEAFFHSALGQAAQDAIARATAEIVLKIPNTYWEPLIAGMSEDQIILNGGHDRGFRTGQRFAVHAPGEDVTDPITGRVLTTISGKPIGNIQVTRCDEGVAFAKPLDGGPFKRMQRLSTQARR